MNIPIDEPAESGWRTPIPWLETVNKALATLIEIPAALLVLAEVVVLLMGVTSRYLLHEHPSCSSGLRCSAPSWRSSAANTCA